MSVFVHPGRHRVAVLVRDGLLPMELGIVHQLFGGAVDDTGRRLYEVVTCAYRAGEVRTNAEFSVNVAAGLEALDEADTVILPASESDADCDSRPPPEAAAALARVRADARIAAICTGAFVLAAAGLLEGRSATTHWKSAERFRRLFPGVRLDPDVLYVDNGQILTSAGEAAGIDLCLHMIRRDFGAKVTNELARGSVVPPHREGGQAQYIRHPVPPTAQAATARAREWALRELHRPISLRELAAHESMSTRHFTRRFREEVGVSPGQWLKERRMERARTLLEDSDLPIDKVAAESGFGTGTALRQHFHDTLGVSPRAYRGTFRGRETR